MTIGFGCSQCNESHYDETYFDLTAAATITGIVERVCVCTPTFVYSSVIGKVKIFRDDGTNYLFIDEESITLYSNRTQVYNLSGSLSIQSGDFIGIYAPEGGGYIPNSFCCSYGGASGSAMSRSGDITTNSLKTAWVSEWYTPSIIGYFSYYIKTSGDDTLNGQSWANAWATVNKGATTVTDGGTIHIEHGTYNAEPANNKIAPQNAGASGIEYQINTTGGGTGTATVTVEKN